MSSQIFADNKEKLPVKRVIFFMLKTAACEKPMLFFVPDYDKYSSFRGLYPEVKEGLPGPEIYTNDELVESIKNIEQVKRDYADKYESFYNTYCEWGHGSASEDVINIVFGGAKNE